MLSERRMPAAVSPIDGHRRYAYHVYIMKDAPSLGQFEQIVMTAILALDENAYGVTIHAKVEQLSRAKTVSRGAVYATLDRLEDKQLIASWLSEPTKERGGRSRRHYRLEKNGEKALRESAQEARRLYETIADNWRGIAWKPIR